MDWRELEAMTDNIVLGANTEQVRLSFMKGGTADPSRPQWVGPAVLHTGGDDSFAPGSGGVYRTRLSAGQAELFLTRSTYQGPVPVTGDRVRALDRAGTPLWEIKSVSDRYSHLWVFSLSQA